MDTARGLGRTVRVLYVSLLMGALGYGAYHLADLNKAYWSKLAELSGRDLIVVAIGSIVVATALDGLDVLVSRVRYPWLSWRLFSQNINFLPLNYWQLRLPFMALLLFNLPALAWVEEMVFRHDFLIWGTRSWPDALWRSAVFGLVHLLAGVRVRATLALTLAGLWLSWHYMEAGLDQAVIAHLIINALGLAMVLVNWAETRKNPFAEQ